MTIGDIEDAVDIEELRDLLGPSSKRGERVSRAYAQVVAGRKGFPDPIVDRRNVRLWKRPEVLTWLAANRDGPDTG